MTSLIEAGRSATLFYEHFSIFVLIAGETLGLWYYSNLINVIIWHKLALYDINLSSNTLCGRTGHRLGSNSNAPNNLSWVSNSLLGNTLTENTNTANLCYQRMRCVLICITFLKLRTFEVMNDADNIKLIICRDNLRNSYELAHLFARRYIRDIYLYLAMKYTMCSSISRFLTLKTAISLSRYERQL